MRKLRFVLLAFVLIMATGCGIGGVGQLFGPTATPTPTDTSTPTVTQTPTVIPTQTPFPTPAVLCEDGLRSYDVSIPTSGSLSTLDSSCTDAWAFTGDVGTDIMITMTSLSGNLPPDFSLWSNTTTLVGDSVDSATQATLSVTLPYTGDYYLIVMTSDASVSGTYSLSIQSTGYTAPLPTDTPEVVPTRVYVRPTSGTSYKPTQGVTPNLGTVPVTFTNNTSHRMKIVAVGPITYTFFIDSGSTQDLNWAPGNYTLTAYYDTGGFYASTTYAVNENHALFTLN
jgi:hypothetical protein